VKDPHAPGRSAPALVTPSQKEVDREARLIWAKTAEALAPGFNESFDQTDWTSKIASSPLTSSVVTFPDEQPARRLGFSLLVTESAAQQVIREVDDPFRMLFVSSRLVELGMYTFVDPSDLSRKPRTHLAASKSLGYFFTPPEIATEMADSVLGGRKRVSAMLDPAAGLGVLLGAAVLRAQSQEIQLDHVLGLECDAFTADLATMALTRLQELTAGEWTFSIQNCDAIERLMTDIEGGAQPFDGVILNPPYGRVKFLESFLTNSETRARTDVLTVDEHREALRAEAREKAVHLKRLSEALGLGAGEQNLQRLFIAMSHRRLAADGRMCVISPSSWLGDRDGEGLRRHLIAGRSVESILIYPEDSGLFATVNQVVAVVTLTPQSNRKSMAVRLVDERRGSSGYAIDYAALEKADPHKLRIPRLDRRRMAILSHLQRQRRIDDLDYVKNARGELDLTFHKAHLSSDPSLPRLIRGDHVERFVLRPAEASSQPSYVQLDAFLDEGVTASKFEDIKKRRLVCRQVSYMSKARRLSFALVPEGSVLGNSCNYLSVSGCEDEDSVLYALMLTLNSAVVEWFFRVFNSNNHVANYEIAELPVWHDECSVRILGQWGRYLEHLFASGVVDSARAPTCEDISDALVLHSFNVEPPSARVILEDIDPARAPRVHHLVQWLSRNGIPGTITDGMGWPQHIAPSLSGHDLEVASHIPQGGNWQNIPEHIPSKRLEQIREMTIERGGAVRTSYYGRLRADQPAYTIATYYNRPGNGTNIVPWVDRTLTSREAARLQSFPDWYLFVPSEASNRKHIGNAVPPLLAYAVGKRLLDVTGSNVAVDLFAGAGGLSLGLELAGWDVAVAVDNDQRALATYTVNRPSESNAESASDATLVVEQDLASQAGRVSAVAAIRAKLDGREVALLVGGPPCQGFSTAGWRLKHDERNDLAVAFLELVEELAPEAVVLENVEGLLNYRRGEVVNELLLTLQELGYQTGASPWVLAAEQFGVPQMRRRVFLVGSRTHTSVAPPQPLFERCRGRREYTSHTPQLIPTLPYPVTVGEAIQDLPRLGSTTHRSMGSREVRPHYERWTKGEIPTDALLRGLGEEV
jgi:DNA-cytosine methyltransferase